MYVMFLNIYLWFIGFVSTCHEVVWNDDAKRPLRIVMWSGYGRYLTPAPGSIYE